MSGGLLPDQIFVLAAIFKDPAVVCGARAGLDIDSVGKWLISLESYLKEHHQRLSKQPFVIRLDPNATGSTRLTLQDVLGSIGAGAPVVVVDWMCRKVRSEKGSARATDSCKRTATGGIEVLVLGTYAQIFANGSVAEELDFVDPRKGPPLGQVFQRPMCEFKKLLADHVENDVLKERSFRYWADKANRTLLAKPESTEKIFQRALFNWLDRNVIDKIKIVCETRGFGQDPADVLVITASGSHIVEIKWLGKNEHNTTWSRDRIDEGLHQVRQYLEKDAELSCGHLVVYDGRPEATHKDESKWLPTYKHSLCSNPEIVFLESDSPSVKATLAVKAGRVGRRMFKSVNDHPYSTLRLYNFESNRDLPRHRWFQFKEGFSADLVKLAASDMGRRRSLSVLDPFAGSGTTAIEGGYQGLPVTAIEVNPFLRFAIAAKCVALKKPEEALRRIVSEVMAEARPADRSPLEGNSTFVADEVLGQRGLFAVDVVREFTGLQTSIRRRHQLGPALELALLSALLDCCNARRDGKCLRYVSAQKQGLSSAQALRLGFHEHANQVVGDIARGGFDATRVRAILGDSRQVLSGLDSASHDLVITSPPYLNSFDYSDVYRPELFAGGFVKSNEDLRKIRLKTLCSHVQVKRQFSDAIESQLLEPVLKRLEGVRLWNKNISGDGQNVLLGHGFHSGTNA